jgi:magnesium chelatase family protein
VTVGKVAYRELGPGAPASESTAAVGARVLVARRRQQARGGLNSGLGGAALQAACALGPAENRLLAAAMDRLGLSARGCHRALAVARTVADLDGIERVGAAQLTEALGYRRLDRSQAPRQTG